MTFMLTLLKTILLFAIKLFGVFLILLLILIIILSIRNSPGKHVEGKPCHHLTNGFRNSDPDLYQGSFSDVFPFLLRRIFGFSRRGNAASPFSMPLPIPNFKAFMEDSNCVVWIGQSTVLVRMEGVTFLTDPVWSERASPFSWYGPKRITPVPFPLDSLPPVDFVLISHDHYDHLDLATIQFLGKRGVTFFVPLGLKTWFADIGIKNVVELDWDQESTFKSFAVHCIKAQHFSGRSPWQRNTRLWCGWVVIGKEKHLYFAGDTGYFQGFSEIGQRLGPFDLVCVPIGAYQPEVIMRPVHLNPEESLQVFRELGGKNLLPIHWGTFILSDEPVDEPPRRLIEAGKKANIEQERLWIMKPGEVKKW